MNTYEIEVLIGTTYTTEVVAKSLEEAQTIGDAFDPDNTNEHYWEIGETDRVVTIVSDESNQDGLTDEQRYRRNVVLTALRIASDLESLEMWADKAFYTDDDNDLDAHYVSDGEWFQHSLYPFRFTPSPEKLARNIKRWAHKLQSTIDKDLLTQPTNNQ